MKSILKDLLGLLTSIFVLFNLETLSLGASSTFSVSSPTKILAVLSVLLIVAGWRLWSRYSIYLPLLLVISTSFAISVIYSKQHIIYLFNFLEIALLSALVYFSHAVSKWISYISEELESMLMRDIKKPIAKLTDSIDDINTYLYQSRRSGNPLSVIVLDVKDPANRSVLSNHQEIILRELAERYLKRYLKVRLINRIISGFRRSDMIVMCTEYDSRLLIMCPSTSLERCNTVAQRIQTSAAKDLELPIAVGAASFPSDGFTLEALIRAAESNLVDGKNTSPIEETEEQAA
jgi:hypothetical protein